MTRRLRCSNRCRGRSSTRSASARWRGTRKRFRKSSFASRKTPSARRSYVTLRVIDSRNLRRGASTKHQPRHADVPGKTNIDIAADDARPRVIVAVIVQSLVGSAEAQGQRPRIERTAADARLRLARRDVRQIHVPEGAGNDRLGENLRQHLTHPAAGALAIDLHAALAIMRKGDGGLAVQGGLADGGDGAGVIDIGAEIAAVVHAGEYPDDFGGELRQRDAHAVGGGAVDG